MYHRIYFNFFCLALISVEVIMVSLYFLIVQSNLTTQATKMVVTTVLVMVFTVHVIVVRPYRSNFTKLFYILGMLGFAMQTLFIQAIVAQFQNSMLIDQYFFTVTSIINGMIWFFATLTIFYVLITRGKWATTAQSVEKQTRNQEVAIYNIKQSFLLKKDVFAVKKMSTSNAFRLQNLIDNLTS